jgi:hypothetical protein
MKSRVRAGLVLVAAGLMASVSIAAGCGDDDDGGDTVSAETYVGGVCTAMSDMIGVVQEGREELADVEQATPEQGRDLMVGFLGDAAGAVESARTAIEDVGTPDVEGGEEVHTAITGALGDLQTTFEDALASAEDISTESEEAFQTEAQELASTIQESSDQISESLGEVGENQELSDAADQVEACQEL